MPQNGKLQGSKSVGSGTKMFSCFFFRAGLARGGPRSTMPSPTASSISIVAPCSTWPKASSSSMRRGIARSLDVRVVDPACFWSTLRSVQRETKRIIRQNMEQFFSRLDACPCCHRLSEENGTRHLISVFQVEPTRSGRSRSGIGFKRFRSNLPRNAWHIAPR